MGILLRGYYFSRHRRTGKRRGERSHEQEARNYRDVLRSLRERTGLDIRPRWMDAETYDRNFEHSLEMSPREVALTARLLKDWHEPFGREVLERLVERQRWIEQEQILMV